MSGLPAYLQPVGVNARRVGAATALIVDTHERILLGCGESLQRLASEWRLRISKVTDVVLTQTDPLSVGGLIGLLLSLEGIESPTHDSLSKKARNHLISTVGAEKKYAVPPKRPFNSLWVDQRWRSVHGGPSLINPASSSADAGEQGHSITVWWRPLRAYKTNEIVTPTYEDYLLARSSVRNIRVWVPAGFTDIAKSHVDLTARLRRLAVDFVELKPYQGGVPFTRDILSTLELDLQFWPLQSPKENATAKRQRLDDQEAEEPVGLVSRVSCIPLIAGKGMKQQGRLLADKARSLGVPSGPMMAQLKAGEDVTLKDGTIVRSSDVCEPSVDGVYYLITHCQSESDVVAARAMIESEPGLIAHMKCLRETGGYVFDMGVKNVFDGDADVTTCQDLLEACPTRVRRIVLTDESNDDIPLPFVAQQGLNWALQALLPQLHPLAPVAPSPAAAKQVFLQHYQLAPAIKIKPEQPQPKLLDLIAEERAEIEKRLPQELANRAHETRIPTSCEVKHACAREFHAQSFNISLLGTGAAMPSKFRNVSSTIICVEEGLNVLLDCGEGTLTQLHQLYGRKANEAIRNIQLIFISHKHGDHINGLPGLLAYRQKLAGRAPLRIAAPAEMEDWIENHCSSKIEFVDCESFVSAVWQPVLSTASMTLTMRTAYVEHINCGYDKSNCFACRLRLSLGPRKQSSNPLFGGSPASDCAVCEKDVDVAFSGDLAPCAGFTELISKDAKPLTVLIHEATFEDELREEAVARKHCTVSDCVAAAKQSQCKLLIMTHFSQRYPSIPATDTAGITVAHGVDFLTIPLSSLWSQPDLHPAVGASLELDKEMIAALSDRLRQATNENVSRFL